MNMDELVFSVKGSVDPSRLDPSTPCVLLEHIETMTGVLTPATVGALGLRSQKKTFEAGDILFGKLRPALRKVVVADCDGVCSSDIAVFRPRVPQAHLIAAFLRSDEVAHELAKKESGASLPRINQKHVLAVEIDWPDKDGAERGEEIAKTVLMARQAGYRMLERCLQIERALAVG